MKLTKWIKTHLEDAFLQIELRRAETWCEDKDKFVDELNQNKKQKKPAFQR